jgi:hypothetical protein
MSLPSSELKNKPKRNHRESLFATCFHSGFLFGVFFNPEYLGDMFLQNVG